MPVYQAWCRPHGRPDAAASMSFLVDRVDYRTAWQDAMAICFNGGDVNDAEGNRHKLAARRWTVQKLKLFELIETVPDVEQEDEVFPTKDLQDPTARERELDRLYAGRRYDNVRLRAVNMPRRLSA